MNDSVLLVDHEIVLDPLLLSDAEILWELIQANREYLGKYLAWVSEVRDVSSTERFIRLRVDPAGIVSAWYKVYVADQLCGIFGAKSIDGGVAELGCFIAECYQGRGIISRCVSAFSEKLTRDYDVSEIEWCCLPQNTSSVRVAERFGAVLHSVEALRVAGSSDKQILNVYRKTLSGI